MEILSEILIMRGCRDSPCETEETLVCGSIERREREKKKKRERLRKFPALDFCVQTPKAGSDLGAEGAGLP